MQRRDALLPGASVAGPAILAEPTSTTFVPDGWQAECLPTGDLMLKDLTLVTFHYCLLQALEAAEELKAEQGIDLSLIHI